MKMKSTEYIQMLDGKLKYVDLTCLCSMQNIEDQRMVFFVGQQLNEKQK